VSPGNPAPVTCAPRPGCSPPETCEGHAGGALFPSLVRVPERGLMINGGLDPCEGFRGNQHSILPCYQHRQAAPAGILAVLLSDESVDSLVPIKILLQVYYPAEPVFPSHCSMALLERSK
jgi:hypothetical protein